MTEANGATGAAHAQPNGRVFRWALAYDLLLNIIWRGSARIYREKTVELAEVRPGEAVLDIGCGTGTLAIAAKQRVGPSGRVFGMDASREMLSRACKRQQKLAPKSTSSWEALRRCLSPKRHSTSC